MSPEGAQPEKQGKPVMLKKQCSCALKSNMCRYPIFLSRHVQPSTSFGKERNCLSVHQDASFLLMSLINNIGIITESGYWYYRRPQKKCLQCLLILMTYWMFIENRVYTWLLFWQIQSSFHLSFLTCARTVREMMETFQMSYPTLFIQGRHTVLYREVWWFV